MSSDPFCVAAAEAVLNRHAGDVYTPHMDAILSDAALATARATISGWPGYAPTPLVPLPGLAASLGIGALLYKDEGPRFGLGSFKALGGAYAVSRLLARHGSGGPVTVTCATDGNHGRSVAWGARLFGCPSVIFIHATVSEGRKAAIEAYGARIVRTAGNYDDSVREAQRVADENGWFVVSDTSYPGYREVPRDVMQGYEVMAAEAAAQLEEPPTHIFLQTGVGGMAAAVAAWFWRHARSTRPKIILGDPAAADCWYRSIAAGHPVAVGGDLDTLMAGLACGEVSELAWEILSTGADAVVRLPDVAATAAMRILAEGRAGDRPIVAGESAVAGLAALAAVARRPDLAAALDLGPRSRVLVFGSEADTDPDLYRTIIGRSGDDIRTAAAHWISHHPT